MSERKRKRNKKKRKARKRRQKPKTCTQDQKGGLKLAVFALLFCVCARLAFWTGMFGGACLVASNFFSALDVVLAQRFAAVRLSKDSKDKQNPRILTSPPFENWHVAMEPTKEQEK